MRADVSQRVRRTRPPPLARLCATAGTLALLAITLAGCQSGANVTVAINVPAPLVEPNNTRVGLYFEEALTSFVHTEDHGSEGDYRIDIGASQAPVFAQVFEAAFDEVVPMGRAATVPPEDAPATADGETRQPADQAATAPPTPFHALNAPVLDDRGRSADVAGVRTIFAPTIDEVQLATPKQTSTEFFEVWIRYRIMLFDPLGDLRTECPVIGYGKVSRRNHSDQSDALNAAAVWALRDAAAVLVLRLSKQTRPLDETVDGGCPL